MKFDIQTYLSEGNVNNQMLLVKVLGLNITVIVIMKSKIQAFAFLSLIFYFVHFSFCRLMVYYVLIACKFRHFDCFRDSCFLLIKLYNRLKMKAKTPLEIKAVDQNLRTLSTVLCDRKIVFFLIFYPNN